MSSRRSARAEKRWAGDEGRGWACIHSWMAVGWKERAGVLPTGTPNYPGGLCPSWETAGLPPCLVQGYLWGPSKEQMGGTVSLEGVPQQMALPRAPAPTSGSSGVRVAAVPITCCTVQLIELVLQAQQGAAHSCQHLLRSLHAGP